MSCFLVTKPCDTSESREMHFIKFTFSFQIPNKELKLLRLNQRHNLYSNKLTCSHNILQHFLSSSFQTSQKTNRPTSQIIQPIDFQTLSAKVKGSPSFLVVKENVILNSLVARNVSLSSWEERKGLHSPNFSVARRGLQSLLVAKREPHFLNSSEARRDFLSFQGGRNAFRNFLAERSAFQNSLVVSATQDPLTKS